MRILITALFLVLAGSQVSLANQPAYVEIEYALEEQVSAFYLGKDLQGYVKTKACDQCKERTTRFNSKVKAFLDGKEVSLSQFVMSKHKPTGIYIDRNTHVVKRMTWFSKYK